MKAMHAKRVCEPEGSFSKLAIGIAVLTKCQRRVVGIKSKIPFDYLGNCAWLRKIRHDPDYPFTTLNFRSDDRRTISASFLPKNLEFLQAFLVRHHPPAVNA